MTGHDAFDRTVAQWLEAEALSPPPAGGRDRVLDATRRRRPRPAWIAGLGGHWVGEPDGGTESGLGLFSRNGIRAPTAIILILAIAALMAGAMLVGARLLEKSAPILEISRLVYVLNNDIYLADGDGANSIQIVDTRAENDCIDWVEADGLVSPDRRHIAYRSNSGEGCRSEIIITDPDGRVVVSLPGEGRGVAWSPDSTRVATWLTWRGPDIGIYGIDGVLQAVLDGSKVCCDQDYSRPVWSRAAASLLIGRHRDDPITPIGWELPINGDPARPVAEDDPRFTLMTGWKQGAYSPDGTRMVFVRADGLAVAAADGTQPEVLVEQDVAALAPGVGISALLWSPMGDRIAYRLSREASEDAVGDPTLLTSDIWIVDPRTGTSTMVATALPPSPIQRLAFSPGGDRILFGLTDEDGNDSLWSVNIDGSGARMLVAGTTVGAWVTLPAGAAGRAVPLRGGYYRSPYRW